MGTRVLVIADKPLVATSWNRTLFNNTFFTSQCAHSRVSIQTAGGCYTLIDRVLWEPLKAGLGFPACRTTLWYLILNTPSGRVYIILCQHTPPNLDIHSLTLWSLSIINLWAFELLGSCSRIIRVHFLFTQIPLLKESPNHDRLKGQGKLNSLSMGFDPIIKWLSHMETICTALKYNKILSGCF